MTQLLSAIGTILLGFFYENPSDAPLWASITALSAIAIIILAIVVLFSVFLAKFKDK